MIWPRFFICFALLFLFTCSLLFAATDGVVCEPFTDLISVFPGRAFLADSSQSHFKSIDDSDSTHYSFDPEPVSLIVICDDKDYPEQESVQEPVRKNQENKRRLLKILRKKMQQDIARGHGDVARIHDNRIMLIEVDLEHLADLDAEALAQQIRIMFSAGLASQNDGRQVPNEGEEKHRDSETPSTPAAGRQEGSNPYSCAKNVPQDMSSMNDRDDEGEEPPGNNEHTYSTTIDCPLCHGGPCEQALIQAVMHGTLNDLLDLLKTGVSANAYDTDERFNHVLSYADTLPQVIALLSYGANPADAHNIEYNYAMSDNRWFHLVVYYFWSKFKENNQPSPPADIQELNNIVCSLPILEINRLTRFLENEIVLDVIKDPQEKYPINVRSFFKFLRD